MPKRRKSRLYYRGARGWYADFRDFADVGGKREAMTPDGSATPTHSEAEATALMTARLGELEKMRERQVEGAAPFLEDFARVHLRDKALSRAESTVTRDEQSLRIAIAFFGDVRLDEIGVKEIMAYVRYRMAQPGNRGGTIAAQTVRNELNALSSLYRRAVAEGAISVNPVLSLPARPMRKSVEVQWLEVGEAAAILDAAAEIDRNPPPRAVRFLAPLLATHMLTGGRNTEVWGLEVKDIAFDYDVVRIVPNAWRRLKGGQKHARNVPLWPQLRATLEAYIEESRPTGLLFPSPRGGMLKTIQASLSSAVRMAGVGKHVTVKTFRHTYAATRIQTTDHGAPVSVFTVARELGHSDTKMIEQVYGHLQNVRHRLPYVEFKATEVIDLVTRRKA